MYLISIAGGLSGSLWTKYAQNVSRIFALFTFGLMGLVIYNLAFIYLGFAADGIDFTNFNQMSILAVAGVSIGGFAFLLIIHFFTHPRLVCRMICDSFSYWYYQGAYQHTLVVNSFCNVDDVSWGTKGSTSKHGGKGYQNEKVFFVSGWIFWNSLLAYLLIYIDIVIAQPGLGPWNNRRYGLIIILMWGTSQLLIKLILAVWHHFKFHLTCCYNTLEPGRKEKVDALWEGLKMEYKQIERMAIDKLSHSQIMQVASHPASKKR